MGNMEGFDATQHDAPREFTPLPGGDYVAIAIESEIKPTKAGTGKYLQFTWEIIDGEHKGRRVWSRHNVENPNDTAVKIGQSEIAAICKAVGVLRPKDSSELHGVAIVLKVKVKKREDTGQLTNEIKSYKPLEQKGESAPAAANGNGQSAPASKPPWARSA